MKTAVILILIALGAFVKAADPDWTQSTYLNLHVSDTHSVFNLIQDAFSQGIQQVHGSYIDFLELYLYLNKLKSNPVATDSLYHQPDSYHMTTYYRGNNPYSPTNQAYIEYMQHPGEAVVITVPAILFIPNRIVTGVLFSKAFTNNKYRHMTMMLGDMQAVDSNYVLANIFDADQIYERIYKDFDSYRGTTIKFHHKFLNESKESLAFLIVLDNPVNLIAYREATFLP